MWPAKETGLSIPILREASLRVDQSVSKSQEIAVKETSLEALKEDWNPSSTRIF